MDHRRMERGGESRNACVSPIGSSTMSGNRHIFSLFAPDAGRHFSRAASSRPKARAPCREHRHRECSRSARPWGCQHAIFTSANLAAARYCGGNCSAFRFRQYRGDQCWLLPGAVWAPFTAAASQKSLRFGGWWTITARCHRAECGMRIASGTQSRCQPLQQHEHGDAQAMASALASEHQWKRCNVMRIWETGRMDITAVVLALP